MSDVVLTEKLLAQAGGWQAMKEARALLAEGRVISANWNPPNLSGEVRGPAGPMNSGLIIKDHINIENLCRCRESRQWGKICGHAIAVGLKFLQPPEAQSPVSKKEASRSSSQPAQAARPFPLRFAESPAEADHARLHLVFPPNLDAALARGSATVACEFSVDDKLRPLNLVARDEPLYWSEQDRVILSALLARCDNEPPAVVSMAVADFAELLTELAGFERATFGRRDSAVIRTDSVTPPVSAELKPDGSIVLAAKWPKPMPTVLPGRVFWLLDGREFRPLQLPPGGAALLQGSLTLKRAQVPAFLQNDFPVLSAGNGWTANFQLSDFDVSVAPPVLAVQLEGGLARLRARVVATYGKQSFDLGDTSVPVASPWIIDPAGPTSYRLRDLAAEQDCLARLVRAGFEGPDREGSWRLSGQDDVLRFFARDYPDWQRRFQVTLEERLDRSLEKNVERVEARCEVRSSGEQWFDFGVRYQTTGGEVFSPADIQRLVLGGQSHTKTRGGKFALIDTGAVEELQEVLVDAAPRQEDGGYRFRNEQAAYLSATIDRQADWKLEAPTAWRERVDLVATPARAVDLGAFNDVLRPYQREGVQWLHKLRAGGFGGVLADEMGLGKTLQAITYIATRGQGASGPVAPCLVVCPTSLIFNWRAELEKFAPGLNVLVLHGPERHALFASIPEHDVIITSYALVRRDAEQHREHDYDTVILDEAQHIKNRRSQNAQAVKSVRSAHRLVLTGTPMENSVLDLWSIFDFLMPGYLGNEKDFKERYELPLTRAKDAAVQGRLTRRVRPFILRRMKRDVAADLPDKIEQVAYCELNAEQRGAYEQVLEAGRREVLEAVGKQGFGKSKMVIFNALLRLRQIACDLRLLPDQRDEKFAASGKLELFDELLEEITDGGHRVLVFSQFTKMLGLVRERLEAESIDYCYLDGSTRDRGEVVARFQRSTVPVFLISLKAGGVGLNLTGADTVVHFDPWWNPAVEDQATDRAHRIGQQRVVTSYKLIARDTVEEKILKLQQRKREAVRAVFGGEEQLTDALDWEEVQELFA